MDKVYGIGINDMPRGWIKECKWNYKIYNTWNNMLERCYSKNFQEKHPTYKDCYVCDRWLLLSNFVGDFKLIEGYDEEEFLNNKLVLDKDIKSDNQNKCYCLEQCKLVSQSENAKQASKHRDYSDMQSENHPMYGKYHSNETKQKMSMKKQGINHPYAKKVTQYDKQGNLIRVWDYMKQASNELKINISCISLCCRGKLKSAGSYVWRYYEEK